MDNNLRTITTARTLEAINKGAKDGYWPLVKPVIPSPLIKSKYAVYQNQTSGEIKVINDFRAEPTTKEMDKVIDFTYYYPHNFDILYLKMCDCLRTLSYPTIISLATDLTCNIKSLPFQMASHDGKR